MVMFRPYRDAAFSLKQVINKFSTMRAIKCSLHLYCVHRRLLKAMQHAQQLQRVSQSARTMSPRQLLPRRRRL